MKNFESFVNHIVTKWRTENKIISEKAGLGISIPNRIAGDFAERYVFNKVDKLIPNYRPYFAKGSQTPSDIYSIARRDGYWHIMLIQVKSSTVKNNIYELNKSDIELFSNLASFIIKEIKKSDILEDYKDKPIIITTGYAGVLSIEFDNKVQHRLSKIKVFKLFKMNASKLDIPNIKEKILISHKLGTK